jgi:putative tributyrin esterase
MSNVVDGFFYSSLNQKNVPYRVVIPRRMLDARRPLGVLYLLHGLFGSWENWSDLTNLQAYAADADFLIVMPDGGDNWYTDSHEQYESYLIRDLLPSIEKEFGASPGRNGRAIAGNSMGGYGALKLALRRPDLFSFAASFSGALDVTRYDKDSCHSDLKPSVLRIFGPEGSDVRSDNDLFAIARRAVETRRELPRIYFDCGSDDDFIEANREFSSMLLTAGVEHEYSEVEGGHDWSFWDKRLRHLLPVLNEGFS